MNEQLYNIALIIERLAFENNGIFWGSYVSAKCLHSYYSTIYYNEDLPIEKYWDSSFHPETKDRILYSNNINIAFPKVNNYKKFWDKCVNNSITIEYNDNLKLSILEYPEIEITIILMTEGGLLPPFNEITFLCDGFIMFKKNENIQIKYSRNTGTPFDNLSDKKFKIVENNIFKELYQKKTMICNINRCDISKIYEIINNGWKISNLPYSIITSNYDISECIELSKFSNNNCFICLEKLFDDDISIEELAIIYKDITRPETVYYPIHHKCLIKYILHKNSKIMKCPYRFTINFSNCEILVNYEYYMINSNKQKYII